MKFIDYNSLKVRKDTAVLSFLLTILILTCIKCSVPADADIHVSCEAIPFLTLCQVFFSVYLQHGRTTSK